MRTLKLIWMLNEMLESIKEESFEEINSNSINIGIWNCQKLGAMEEYNFLPIQDGPLSTDVFTDICLLKMFGIIDIHESDIKFNKSHDIPALISKSEDIYSEEVGIMRTVIKKMKDDNLLVDEDKIFEHWESELDELNISFE